ncbi:hypothetical protein N7457_007553 [Penicillium paradoxum]|uniref:uncharacterized protein n=1 Tax=Penicillium paradoxum TaxID=176176 RepID=UPI00254889D1|nr:uncharacterized protein N7457_007553 [Penicillium paradoxum]KAJ5779833.1 hypothetical protein N7457_007553 [Penicillium paradoxum]
MSAPSFPLRPEDLVHPPQPEEIYDFTQLADPPDDWKLFNISYDSVVKGRVRNLQLPQVKVLLAHYFWGMHYVEPVQLVGQVRKLPRLNVLQAILFKCFYYMQDIHRPKNYAQMLDVNRDSGPRLLRYDIDPRPQPISRWYPNLPQANERLLRAYLRPPLAPPDMPDYLLQQYMYSVESFYTPPSSPSGLPPAPTMDARDDEFLRVNLLEHMNPGVQIEPQYSLTTSPRPEEPKYSYKRYADDDEQSQYPGKRRRDMSPGAPAYREGPRAATPPYQEPVFAADELSSFTWIPSLAPSDTVMPIGRLQLSPIAPKPPPNVDTKIITDAVERALMEIVYDDLERDPSVPALDKPGRNRTARCCSDMLKMRLGAFSCTENIRLSPLDFQWDPNGSVFPLRGRGPIWNNMSCATDAVIVAGMLLDVGCTKIDLAHNRAAEFKDIEKAFVEVTNASWETLDEKTSIFVRDEFLQLFIDGQSQLKMGMPIPPWAIWSVVTKSFAQFRYYHVERVTPCRCTSTMPFINSHQGSCILPGYQKGDENGVDLQTLIERCFYQRKSFRCNNCNDPMGVTGERKIGQLPLRLVMTFDLKTRIKNHTNNLHFNYIDYEDKPQVAHYRWLGGVYNNEYHARLFWTDTKRGERDEGNIMMYDCQLNSGVLVGGIPPFQEDDKVPTEWVNHKAIPLLFFERILNPTSDLIAKAHNAVYDMGHCVSQKRVVLEEHDPWTPPPPPAKNDPWPRILSHNGERFSDFNPDWATGSRPPSTAPVNSPLATIDPMLLDPSVIDPSLIDPALYSTSTPPLFDLSPFDIPPGVGLSAPEQISPGDPNKTHIFNSMMDTPDWFSPQPDLWPSGPPMQEGALEFPNLPTWPSPPQNERRGTISSDIDMPDAETPPISRKASGAPTNELKKAAVANYAMAKQALDPQQKKKLEEQRKDGFMYKQNPSQKEIDARRKEQKKRDNLTKEAQKKEPQKKGYQKKEDQKKQEERKKEDQRQEEKKRQEEHEQKKREERKNQEEQRKYEGKKKLEQEKEKVRQEEKQREKDRKDKEERYQEAKDERERRGERRKPKAKKPTNVSDETTGPRRAGLRARNNKPNYNDPSWTPQSDSDMDAQS